jgi:hypothetical protein
MTRRERPRGRAAEKRYELTPFQLTKLHPLPLAELRQIGQDRVRGPAASQEFALAEDRNGSNPVLRGCRLNVRITPESGRRADIDGRPRSAITGREQMHQPGTLFDRLVGDGKQRRRHIDAQQFCRM